MASKSDKIQKAFDAWVGDNAERQAFVQANPKIIGKFFEEAVDNASGVFKKVEAARNAAKLKGVDDYLDKAYTEWRSSPEQEEKKQQEYVNQFKDIIYGYMGREGMADEKDVAAFREAANVGVSAPSKFEYDLDAAIERFSNPNIQRQVDRGVAAIERSATARGMNDSSDLRKMISDYAASKASEDYQKAAALANQDRQTALSQWLSENQLQQNADTSRLSGLSQLAGFGNTNVGTTASTELGFTSAARDNTESAYQTRYAQQLAQEEAEKARKAAAEQADQDFVSTIIGTTGKVAGAALTKTPIA